MNARSPHNLGVSNRAAVVPAPFAVPGVLLCHLRQEGVTTPSPGLLKLYLSYDVVSRIRYKNTLPNECAATPP